MKSKATGSQVEKQNQRILLRSRAPTAGRRCSSDAAEGLCIRTQGKVCESVETELKSETMLLTDAKESLCDVLLLATSAST